MFPLCRKRRLAERPVGTRPSRRRRGLTLLELLIAISIMVLVVAALGGLARAVQLGSAYGEGRGTATQHARVVIERITRSVQEATANELFPGFLVVAEEEGGYRFPDTLVVWRPSTAAADPDGLPRFNELVIFSPHPKAAGQLMEITVPGDTRQVPPVDQPAAWTAAIAAVKSSLQAESVPLTSLCRVCSPPAPSLSRGRAAVRFESRLRPSAEDWNAYQAGTLPWDDLAWVQGLRGSRAGVRQAWLRMELQLMPGEQAVADDPVGQQAIPFFGSTALYYELKQ
jgi:prepilin-type N-terminal cleavage/methylation domain-containing protein